MNCLVAIDGSDASKNALVHAIDVADAMDGSVTAAHSVDPSVFEEGGTEPMDLMIGSVAKSTVERATIPVTVVR